MRRLFRWLGLILASIVGLAVLAVLVAWVGGSVIAGRSYDLPPTSFKADDATADLDEGRRIARTLGCYDGCHGDGVGGRVFVDEVLIGTFVAPELTRIFAEMSDAELDRVIRYGIRPDGKSTFVMPSSGFHHLSDEDLNDIVAFVRSLPRGDGPAYAAQVGPLAGFFLLTRRFVPRAEEIIADAPWMAGSPTRESPEAGQYLAITACGECHGMDLRGQADFAPSLAAVAAYSPDDFRRLITAGIAVGDRELGLMKEVATGRFVHFTDREIDALYGHLRTLATSAAEPD